MHISSFMNLFNLFQKLKKKFQTSQLARNLQLYYFAIFEKKSFINAYMEFHEFI